MLKDGGNLHPDRARVGDRRLVEGQRYRVRLDAKDSLGRQGRFRDTLER